MSKEYIEIDIRKVSDMSHPIFMRAEADHNPDTGVLKLTTDKGVEYIFSNVQLNRINAGFTHLFGLSNVESGSGEAPTEWAICFAYSFF